MLEEDVRLCQHDYGSIFLCVTGISDRKRGTVAMYLLQNNTKLVGEGIDVVTEDVIIFVHQ